MPAGIQPTKQDIDSATGGILRDIRINLARAALFKFWLDAKTDADLLALNYSTTDIANLRSAFTDADKLNQVFLGLATQATPYDFRTFIQRLWGTGGAF